MIDKGYKSGFFSIIGCPNVGKSTLLNTLIGQKIAIVSDRAQTTRNRITGILTEKDYQMISSILEQAFYPLINDSPVKVTDTLTSREMQVANLIKKGYSSKQIADELFVTKKAVDYHRTNIRKKLGLDAKTNLQVYLEMNM